MDRSDMNRTFAGVARRATWCLGFGVLTTVLVAWALAAAGEPSWPKARSRYWMDLIGTDLYYVSESFVFGRVERQSRPYTAASADGLAPADALEKKRAIMKSSREEGNAPSRPSWGPLVSKSSNMSQQHASGWPLRCMWYERTATTPVSNTTSEVLGGYELPDRITKGKVTQTIRRALPLRPAWTALVLNSAFFGVVYCVLFAVLRLVRRYRRRASGCCIFCAYDLAGIATDRCPECGEANSRTIPEAAPRLS